MTNVDNSETIPVLYILMRTDLESMNAGKAVAQGAHAANQFEHDTPDPELDSWVEMTGKGFGTTITLDVNGENLPAIVEAANQMGFRAGVTFDPSYPIRDGEVTHLIPLDTCGYVFGDKAKLKILLKQFGLMR